MSEGLSARPPRRRDSLQWRFMAAVAAIAVVFSVAAGALSYRFERDRAHEQAQRTLEGLVAAVERTLAIGAYTRDKVLLAELAGGLAQNELVAAIDVVDTRGEPLAQVGRLRNEPGPAVIERPLISPFDAAESVAMLRVRADAARIAVIAQREAWRLSLLMIAQAALVSVLLYLLAARLVSRPIVALAAALRRMQPGTAERLAADVSHRDDEIGVLVAGANALLDANACALERERRLREEIEAMEAQYRRIFDSSSAGIFVLDGEGRLVNSNPTVSRVVGLSAQELQGLRQQDFLERVFARPALALQMVRESLRSGGTVSGDLELRQQGDQSRWVHCLVSVQPQPDDIERMHMVEGVIYDVTDRRAAERAVRHRAEHDSLTGLRSREGSHELLDTMIAEAVALQQALSVLYLDLDGFKTINDRHGHHAGDEVLAACASRLKGAVRREDMIGRLGGDEFVVALKGVGSRDVVLSRLAAGLLAELQRPIRLRSGIEVQVGCSIGIACAQVHGRDRHALTLAADAAMYEVKRTGKNAFAMALREPAMVPAPEPERQTG